jgi:hypothetical protein
MATRWATSIKKSQKESEMDVLQLEIQIAQDDLTRVAQFWNASQLEIANIVLTGDEVNEVLRTVQRLKKQKLARLTSLQTEGATA